MSFLFHFERLNNHSTDKGIECAVLSALYFGDFL